MTKELETAINKILEDYGVEPTSRGYNYVMEAVAFIIEDEGKSKANN